MGTGFKKYAERGSFIICEADKIKALGLPSGIIAMTHKYGGRVAIDENFKIIYTDFSVKFKKQQTLTKEQVLNDFQNHILVKENECVILKIK